MVHSIIASSYSVKSVLSEVITMYSLGVVLESFFFFFQAEDGIRDLTVTGVQTCALPIWIVRRRQHPDPVHHFWEGAARDRDHWAAARHGFRHRQPEGLHRADVHKAARGVVRGRELVRRQEAEQLHFHAQALGLRPHRRFERAAAPDHEEWGAGSETGERIEDPVVSFL